MTTELYRHYNKAGILLYVGISNHTLQRLGQHQHNAGWFASIARIEVESFETRESALAAEAAAIKAEHPRHNIQHATKNEVSEINKKLNTIDRLFQKTTAHGATLQEAIAARAKAMELIERYAILEAIRPVKGSRCFVRMLPIKNADGCIITTASIQHQFFSKDEQTKTKEEIAEQLRNEAMERERNKEHLESIHASEQRADDERAQRLRGGHVGTVFWCGPAKYKTNIRNPYLNGYYGPNDPRFGMRVGIRLESPDEKFFVNATEVDVLL